MFEELSKRCPSQGRARLILEHVLLREKSDEILMAGIKEMMTHVKKGDTVDKTKVKLFAPVNMSGGGKTAYLMHVLFDLNCLTSDTDVHRKTRLTEAFGLKHVVVLFCSLNQSTSLSFDEVEIVKQPTYAFDVVGVRFLSSFLSLMPTDSARLYETLCQLSCSTQDVVKYVRQKVALKENCYESDVGVFLLIDEICKMKDTSPVAQKHFLDDLAKFMQIRLVEDLQRSQW